VISIIDNDYLHVLSWMGTRNGNRL